MRIHRLAGAGILLAVALSVLPLSAPAERPIRDFGGREAGPERPARDRGAREAAPRHEPGWVLDQRYRHNRYYPPHGYVVDRLPQQLHPIPWHGTDYYYHGGIWYRPYGPRFSVVLPPIGLAVALLPPFYTTIWFGGIPYYYAGGVYYVWQPEERVYVVSEPPPEAEVREQPANGEALFIYPKKGQSAQQQATDRYECHRWGVGQTGFDPTQPGGSVPESQHAEKRADYQRALKACLEGRNYSVR